LHDWDASPSHLILLRNNLLTYYADPLKGQALKRLISHLENGGYLIIGSHEILSAELYGLMMIETFPSIYEKRS